MTDLWQDVKFGVRMLRKAPGFTAVAVLAIALGIGANCVMFSSLKGAVLRPFSFPNQDRIYDVYSTRREASDRRFDLSAGDFLDLQQQSRSFQSMAALHGSPLNLSGEEGAPQQLEGYQVTPSFFSVLQASPALGRVLSASDAVPGRAHGVVISYRLWQQRFASDPQMVGKTLVLDNQSMAVVGVMPSDFDFPMGAEVWLPFAWTDAERADRQNHYLSTFGLLQDGVSPERATAELNTIAARLEQQYPNTNSGLRTVLIGIVKDFTNGQRQFITVLMGAAVFVLLLACANVANLQLARATVRAREMAVRRALGASRGRLVRQLLAENIVLACAGGIAGLLMGAWGIDLTQRQIPPFIQAHVAGLRNIQMDAGVVIFTVVAALATGLICGIVPALHGSHADLNESLKEGGRGSEGRERRRSRSALVITEVAMALVLLVAAGLMVQGFRRLMIVSMGFNPDNTLVFKVRLPKERFATAAQRLNFYNDAVQKLGAIPGVKAASVFSAPPSGWGFTSTFVQVEGGPPRKLNELPTAVSEFVTPDWLATMQASMIAGRNFSASDGPDTLPVALVTEKAARRLWPNQDPIGRRLRTGRDDSQPWRTVVGVVGNIRLSPFNDADPILFTPIAQVPLAATSIELRTAGDPIGYVGAVREQMKSVDPTIPLFDLRTQEQLISDNVSGVHVSANLMIVFGGIALVLAAAGIFAVMAYSVRQRTREIGVRMALGAQRGDVLWLVGGYGARMAGIGIAIGLIVSLAVAKLLISFLLNIVQMNWATVAGFTVLLMLVAAVAALVPARWATRVDPMVALRYE